MCSSDDFFILKIKIIVTGVKNINIFKAFKAHIAKLNIRKITLLTIAQAVFEQSHSLFLSSSNYLITTRAKKKIQTQKNKNLDSILKSRAITLPTKVCLVKAMVFPYSSHVWMWELDYKESWVLKNWCFWTVVLEKTPESPLDCEISQPILKEISPEYSLEELMLKLKLQYFGHLMWRTGSLEKTLMLGKIEDGRGRGWQKMR